jgi:hypothetical protein
VKFTLEIELGNDAMQTPEDVTDALEEVVKQIRDRHWDGWTPGGESIRDINGNTVGRWSLVEDPT